MSTFNSFDCIQLKIIEFITKIISLKQELSILLIVFEPESIHADRLHFHAVPSKLSILLIVFLGPLRPRLQHPHPSFNSFDCIRIKLGKELSSEVIDAFNSFDCIPCYLYCYVGFSTGPLFQFFWLYSWIRKGFEGLGGVVSLSILLIVFYSWSFMLVS